MQQAKFIFWFFILLLLLLLFIYVRPCLAKLFFLALKNYQNGLKGVFVKHPL
jgi:hypothetical protein